MSKGRRKRNPGVPAKKSESAAVGSRSFNRRRSSRPPQAPAAAGTSAFERLRRDLNPMKLARRAPLAGCVCALVAVLNAFAWAGITPPFQVPDESSHFAYVKQLADNHARPTSHAFSFSSEEFSALENLNEGNDGILPPTGSISSQAQQRKLEHALAVAGELPPEGSVAAGVATSEPPLYYLLETIPYKVGSSGNLLTRLELMRLFSALFAGITAMFAFLFVRETLPATPRAWIAGGLSVALAPLLGFMSGSVNPDSLLFAVSAVVFWALARAFRRGLTYRRAAAIGAVTAIGLLTKLNFAGLFPGIIIGLCVLAWRLGRTSRSTAYRALALGAGIAASPVLLVVIVNATTNRPTLGLLSTAASTATSHGPITHALSAIWQAFLPRLPGMKSYDGGVFTARQIWFNGFVGRYGWSDTSSPEWVYTVAGIFGIAVLVALVRTLVVVRKTVRERLAELAVYAVMSLGLLTLIGAASYISLENEGFTETRYLLPLLALFAAAVGLAIRAAGRRWEAVLAAVIVMAMLADNIFGQLLVLGRYYG
jgi:hypothetical protein